MATTETTTGGGVGGGGCEGCGVPPNAFDGGFLDRLLDRDQPPTAAVAAVAGPWEVRPVPAYGWGVYRQSDGGEAAALMEERQEALLLAAALPGSARRGGPRLRPERGPDGYSLSDGGRELGRLAWFDTELVAALGCLRDLVSSPRSLALLLEAAGHDALEQAGRILARRTRDAPPGEV